jgi:hypothetical protein
MISGKMETNPWRENAMARDASAGESKPESRRIPKIVEFRTTPIEATAWDPYEVWLTRVKQPRDARDKK